MYQVKRYTGYCRILERESGGRERTKFQEGIGKEIFGGDKSTIIPTHHNKTVFWICLHHLLHHYLGRYLYPRHLCTLQREGTFPLITIWKRSASGRT